MSKGLAGQLMSTSPQTRASCLACHVPRSEQWQVFQREGPQGYVMLDGIDCASCHVRGHIRFGPRDVANTPHGTVKGWSMFNNSRFCAKCHQFPADGPRNNGKLIEDTYDQWLASRYSREGKTCQGCHLPDGQHEFKGIHDPAMTRQGLQVLATRKADGVHVRASNVGAGHALPTYGTPRIVISMVTSDGGKATSATHVIGWESTWSPQDGWREIFDTRLFPDESVDLVLPVAKGRTARVTVTVKPDADYHDRVYPMLLEKQQNITADDRAMLESARKEGISNQYKLYDFDCDMWKNKEQSCNARS